jgi:hypothetical protein
MADYVLIRSFHILRTWSRVPGRFITLCGRVGNGEAELDFGNEKTCETCLRIARKRGIPL